MRYDRASDRWLCSTSRRTSRSGRRVRGACRVPTEQVLRRRSTEPRDRATGGLRRVLAAVASLPAGQGPHRLPPPRTAAPPRVCRHATRRWERLCARPRDRAFARSDFVDAARSGDDGRADEARRQARGRVAAAQAPAGPVAASELGHIRRVARKPLLVRRRRGVSLALLGPNGVGKSTAAAELQRSLPFDVANRLHGNVEDVRPSPRAAGHGDRDRDSSVADLVALPEGPIPPAKGSSGRVRSLRLRRAPASDPSAAHGEARLLPVPRPRAPPTASGRVPRRGRGRRVRTQAGGSTRGARIGAPAIRRS